MGRVLIIAEAGVNHNGQVDLAFKLCDAAKKAGADVVKFQTFKTEECLTREVPMAAYQKKNLGSNESQFDMVKNLELSFADFKRLKAYCEKIKIGFMSTAPDAISLDFLVKIGVKTLKVGSGEVTNIPFLRKVGAKKLDVIFSTGMATLGEVDRACEALRGAGARNVALLHCTSNYPVNFDEVNLKAIQTLKAAFGLKTGFSDHTLGYEAAVAAVAMGAEIIEKHFTLDTTMTGPDHRASLAPEEFTGMVAAIRHVERALGDGLKRPQESEKETMKVVRKSLVASCPIKKGTVLSEKNMTVKRAGAGISADLWDFVVGREACCNFQADERIKI